MAKRRMLLMLVALMIPPLNWAAHLNANDVENAMSIALAEMKVKATVVAGSAHFPNMPLLVKGPQLIADRANITPPNRFEVRVRCRPAYACLPFHASAELRMGAGGTLAQRWTKQRERQARVPTKLSPGERVLFVQQQAAGVRTIVQAVTLDAAAIGQMVRVRAVDGKHEVLRGRLYAEHIVRSES